MNPLACCPICLSLCRVSSRHLTSPLPFLALAIVGMLAFTPMLSAGEAAPSRGEKAAAPPAAAATEKTIQLDVAGMESEACELLVERELLSVSDGVVDALADHETGRVEVLFDTAQITRSQLIEAVESSCSFEVLGVIEESGERDGSEAAEEPASAAIV
ncbi:MAG: cation transporter [Holophagales bacterium]|nr:cation transporter [Holophagales bacterium]